MDKLGILRKKIGEMEELPAMSYTVKLVSRQTAKYNDSTITELTDTILQDFALTNKILRMVNTVYYIKSQFSGKITTISRAVYVLGLEHIRNAALSMVLFENLKNKSLAKELKNNYMTTYVSSIISRELAKIVDKEKCEESFLCAMFYDLGKIITTYYMPDESKLIKDLVSKKGLDDKTASAEVLGISYERIGITLAKDWHLSQQIVHCMHRQPHVKLAKPDNPMDLLRCFVSFAGELCSTILSFHSNHVGWMASLENLIKRYSNCFSVSPEKMIEILKLAIDEVTVYGQNFDFDADDNSFVKISRQLLSSTGFTSATNTTVIPDYAPMATREYEDIGGIQVLDWNMAMSDARETTESILNRGILEVATALLEDLTLNDILRMVIEVMFRGMHCSRIIILIRNPKESVMEGRFGFGENVFTIIKNFRFITDLGADDIFNMALSRGSDLLVKNVNDKRIATKLPEWFMNLIDSETFMIMPIRIGKMPIGLIYMDKPFAGDLQIAPTVLHCLKMLRDQAILAIKQKTK
ncbi:MAG: HDOD domain-containing protein [Nitrospirae bacterium]|nr:HDOD domain-containing protein [Nitrospirota bacterium]